MKAGWLPALFAAAVLTSATTAVMSAPALEITEWPVPWADTRPRDPWVEGADRVWFVGQAGDYIATLNPGNGEFRRYDLEPGTGPHTVIADGQGVWYAGNRAGHIGRLDPVSGAVTKLPLPGDGRGDVHTMDFAGDGDIWFTVQHGNQIGRLDAGTGTITLHDVATPAARPYGLRVDPRGQPWVVLFGTHRLATVEGGRVREIELPREEARPRRLALTADGAVWYVDYAEGYLGRYDPDSGEFREWRTPAAERSRPYAMTSDGEGRLWFVETGVMPNRFVGFDPRTETFTEPVEVPSGGGTVRHMVFDAGTGAIWFGTDTNTIGRARLNRE